MRKENHNVAESLPFPSIYGALRKRVQKCHIHWREFLNVFSLKSDVVSWLNGNR